MAPIRSSIFLFLLLLSTRLLAQTTPPLERLISVDIRNERVENALRQISRAGRLEFSYDPTRLDPATLVTVRLTNAPVRQVLNQLFARSMTYKSRGNYIILLRADPPETAPKQLLLDGYIFDEQTGERIAQASIFEKTTLASTVSNPFGYYRIRLPSNLPTIRLDVRKQSYLGETVTVRARFNHSVNIRLTPQPPSTPLQALPIRTSEDTTRPAIPPITPPVVLPTLVAAIDSTPRHPPMSALDRGRMGLMQLFVSAQQAIHDINLSRDTLYRDWQVSLVPYIGTNHRLSGRIINRLSFNVFVGYSLGVRAFEAGGLLNLVRNDVQGVQVAGLGNLVGGQVHGVQAGGLFNLNGGDVRSTQAGGLFNINLQQAQGVQIGGLFNLTLGDMSRGVQIGGLINYTGQSINGVQLAGLFNFARRNVQGWQISGLLNRAGAISGGTQIGLINIAESSGSVPIGLFSHVNNGFRRIEVATNEVNRLNLTYRTGVRQFYNIFTAGSSFNQTDNPWLSVGYGLGTAFRLSPGTLLSLEATGHYFLYRTRTIDDWNQQIRFSPLIETKLSRGLFLAFGPSANWFFSTGGTTRPLLRPALPLFDNRTTDFGNARHWGWIGFQAGLRFGTP
ncbi:hypothetical protein HNV11_03635 [Spirosoma taeanense]|uniref:Secretin/TonB short N-terminal domain-containing protein n=1 Tax=Spirosoma taeanense TaxID=2735870 RepID=A0A6M5Y1B0_9BACT|nr:STN and carboxypeptidase regulatory-like domain-containing protein [Spirosoma taeanense]QJW88528.1 hypothetical protein HNV11_03635 [Spirosoma taeanense]